MKTTERQLDLPFKTSMEASSQGKSSIYGDGALPIGSIRLLKLHHWQRHLQPELVQGSLKEFTLSQAPAFVALSYTWHDERSPLPITINKQQVEVRRNLWEFFRQARWDRQLLIAAPYLWIDAMCINQSDKQEKAGQVQMMGEIYKTAQAVLNRLGEHEKGSEKVFRCVRRAVDDYAHADRTNALKLRDLVGSWTVGIGPPMGQAFSFICGRKSWTRTWVLQECMLVRDILVCCGTSWLPHHALGAAIALVDAEVSLTERRPLAGPYLRWYRMVDSHADNRDITGSLPLLMHYCETTECADIRDKIYSVLSLVNNLPLPVDYAISPTQLCLRGFRSWANTHQSPWEMADAIRSCLGLQWAQVLAESLQHVSHEDSNEKLDMHLGICRWSCATVLDIDSFLHPPKVDRMPQQIWLKLTVLHYESTKGFEETKFLLVQGTMDMCEKASVSICRGDEIIWMNDVAFVFRRQAGGNFVDIRGGLLRHGEKGEAAEEMRRIEERLVRELAWNPRILRHSIVSEQSHTTWKDGFPRSMNGYDLVISLSMASFIVFCAGSSIRRTIHTGNVQHQSSQIRLSLAVRFSTRLGKAFHTVGRWAFQRRLLDLPQTSQFNHKVILLFV